MQILKYKQDFEQAVEYWNAFWEHELIDRPCTVINVRNSKELPVPRIQAIHDDFNSTLDKAEAYLEASVFLGDNIPTFRPGFGPDQMAGFLGTPIIIGPENTNTSWSEKIVNNWSDFMPLEIKCDCDCWKRMIEYHKIAEQRLAGKCLLSTLDFHSNIDGLEGLRGAEKLVFDLIDNEGTVLELMNQIHNLYIEIYNQFYPYGNKEQLGAFSYSGFYSQGKFDMVQADFICLLSPPLFRKFVLPFLELEAQFLDNCCFHLDGLDALKHLDDILTIEAIKAVSWVPGAGGKPLIEWKDVLQKIQDADKAVQLYGLNSESVKAIHKEYKPELVVYSVDVDTQEEGCALLDWLKENT